ncbi:hypothetical protein OIDMADRAFT_32668 [Oidiodendron maius Zn]|uniref:DUF7872 domain-containing protein n=1 Tax=Oidiodendron maius (strain Zn) TaxID=913774 RepID=A0A0C3GKU5_OIDMZ|nr:hypothetical protein OIDMADRAFT_32668 [Oidiodendron maius Zn]
MRTQILLAVCSFSTFWTSLAAPSALLQYRDTTSCPTGPLTADTWESYGVDVFLATWSAVNVTVTPTDNVQSLAASFGAPNFFCGLDETCNAGQPCVPVDIPAWYVLVAIQNWNSYMNAMNTALNFASTMISLALPGIVSDFYPNPTDNITPLQEIGKVFTTALSIVPFTGALGTASSVVTKGLTFVLGIVKPPALPNLFLDWSDVSTSLGKILEGDQNALSSAITTTLNSPVNSSTGINQIVAGGDFLGVNQNFTENDIQSALINSTTVLAISLIFQAQKIFIAATFSVNGNCADSTDNRGLKLSYLCVPNSSGEGYQDYLLTKNDGSSDGEPADLDDFANLLVNKYGISQQTFLVGPRDCLTANGGKQLTDSFNGTIPLDPTTQCLFNILVCNVDGGAADVGIVQDCQDQGLDV